MPLKNAAITLEGADLPIERDLLRASERGWGPGPGEAPDTAGPLTYKHLHYKDGRLEVGVRPHPPTRRLVDSYRDCVVIMPVRYRGTAKVHFLIHGLPPGAEYAISDVLYCGGVASAADGVPYTYFHKDVYRSIDAHGVAGGNAWNPYDSRSGWPDKPRIYRMTLSYRFTGSDGKPVQDSAIVWVLISYNDEPEIGWWAQAVYAVVWKSAERVLHKIRPKHLREP